ncbi:hypothetical protein GCM10017744_059700 [Streptomyces antimycoticus]|uniref:Uncharacterized protein n=1 Tax=Streptomyces antimycoticus TaxID=68175 RepID=A0A4D4KAL0_9ACTN|nr:hypothetical protein SANT12839_042490 [Streptomyces antimycoticus]
MLTGFAGLALLATFALLAVAGWEEFGFVGIEAEASTRWVPVDAPVSAGGMLRPYVSTVDASNARNGDNQSTAA